MCLDDTRFFVLDGGQIVVHGMSECLSIKNSRPYLESEIGIVLPKHLVVLYHQGKSPRWEPIPALLEHFLNGVKEQLHGG